MPKARREGRARRPSRPSTSLATARLRRLVDDVHDGNLVEAAAFARVPYAALREIHSGRASAPQPDVLEDIAEAYGLPPDWFSAPDDGTVPFAGWAGFLPPPPGERHGRRVTIPFGAWPLIRVLVRLEHRLRDLPAEPERPIMGGATDPRECRRRLAAFLLQPVLAARALGPTGVQLAMLPFPGPTDARHPGRERLVGMLHDLGQFWELALGGLLDDPPRSTPEPAAH